MTQSPDDGNRPTNAFEVNNTLEGMLSPVVDHILDDGVVSEQELQMLIKLMENMGIPITPELQMLVEQFLEEELRRWRAQQEEETKKEAEREREELEEAEEALREQVRREKLQAHDNEVSKIIAGISSIVGITAASSAVGGMSPSTGGVAQDKENGRGM